ncbi:MAG: hypothetical protein COB15_00280 [Flavobacteriales bacterium]|nr:MAG: hypothetical protein COB15_00280 [Flavobacteriales bacterium]
MINKMKELHNHIFSNTTCISKETMLRYINKQLSKTELHDVEKHMLDCELCSDAYAGMQYAQNSSMLFAIDNQIDQRVGSGNTKAPIMRNLMVAASVLAIIFGAYFTMNYFNQTINTDSNLAINEVEETINEGAPMEESEFFEIKEREGDLKNFEDGNAEVDDDGKEIKTLYNKKEKVSDNKNSIAVNAPAPILVEQISEEEIRIEEFEMMEDELMEDEVDEFVEEVVLSEEPAVELNNSSSYGYISANSEGLKKEVSNKNRSEKRKFKSMAPEKAISKDEMIVAPIESRDQSQENIRIIDSYKVVDYLEEYQQEYDLENATKIETKSVSAAFESEEDKSLVDKSKEEIVVEITYKETLEKAINSYKNQKYTQAIEEFDMILLAHPKEVNGLFYGAMSNYYLNRYDEAKSKFDLVLVNEATQFNEEANWYKALTLIELKETTKAKGLLKEIVETNGFYKTKAKEKLKEL